jgi:poly-gamma-glutamate synthesis protein (capsule biosynthesis protein)
METKITVLGDIMCEPYLIRAAKQGDTFDFNPLFAGLKDMLSLSDYVIGNLETPVAGAEAKYCEEWFSFNAPDEFLDAISSVGIRCVSTANNHCLDRGMDGLRSTIHALDNAGIGHCGTYEYINNNRIAYAEINGLKVSIVAYTYGTNWRRTKVTLSQDKGGVNLLRPQDSVVKLQSKNPSSKTRVMNITVKSLQRILTALGMPKWKAEQTHKFFHTGISSPYRDDNIDHEHTDPYLDECLATLQEARSNSDFVIFLPHIGGQFNELPGAYSEYVIDMVAESGCCDAIVASHSHVIQKAEIKHGIPCFYSIGNVSMSPNSYYIPKEARTDLGLAVHLYIRDKKLQKVTFSVLRISENKNDMMKIEILGKDRIINEEGKYMSKYFDLSSWNGDEAILYSL